MNGVRNCMKGKRLAVLVLTYNEEKNIKDCLQSASFADEVIVVDSYSEDDTAALAKNMAQLSCSMK